MKRSILVTAIVAATFWVRPFVWVMLCLGSSSQ